MDCNSHAAIYAGGGATNGGSGGLGRGYRYSTSWALRIASGGAGNPGGKGGSDGLGNIENGTGENGTGGLLIIYCNNFNNNGKIESNGSKGGAYGRGPGGSSGGGSINIFCRNNFTRGTIEALGGGQASDPNFSNCIGGKGGDGTVSTGKVTVEGYTEIPVE